MARKFISYFDVITKTAKLVTIGLGTQSNMHLPPYNCFAYWPETTSSQYTPLEHDFNVSIFDILRFNDRMVIIFCLLPQVHLNYLWRQFKHSKTLPHAEDTYNLINMFFNHMPSPPLSADYFKTSDRSKKKNVNTLR